MTTSALHEPKLAFLSGRNIHHIESHSDELADGLVRRVEKCQRLSQLRETISAEELRQHAYDVYRHWGEWLESRSESDVEHRYVDVGERLARQGVSLSELVLSMFATKEHLWEHVTDEVSSITRSTFSTSSNFHDPSKNSLIGRFTSQRSATSDISSSHVAQCRWSVKRSHLADRRSGEPLHVNRFFLDSRGSSSVPLIRTDRQICRPDT
jgi:hypothetical protein